jgi:hypothetical protein
LKPVVTTCTINFNILKLCILLTECNSAFPIVFTINSGCLLKQKLLPPSSWSQSKASKKKVESCLLISSYSPSRGPQIQQQQTSLIQKLINYYFCCFSVTAPLVGYSCLTV